MRNADGLRHLDAGMLHYGLINLAWRDVGAAGLDDVGEPALPVQSAGVVEVAAVAGGEEALRVESFVERGPDIAEHERGPFDADLARLAARNDAAGKGIRDLQRHTGQRHAEAVSMDLG